MSKLLHLPQRGERFCFDFHVHSTASDGRMSPEWIADFAERMRRVSSITDHLRTGAYKSKKVASSPWIHPGIEVKTCEGADFNIHMNTPKDLFAFEKEVIRPANPKNTMLGATRLKFYQLLGAARERGHTTVGIHPFACEGFASMLSEREQREAAEYLSFMELNGLENARHRRKTKLRARELGLRCIAGSDAHFPEHLITYTKGKLPQGMLYTKENVLRVMQNGVKLHFKIPKSMKKRRIYTFFNSAKTMLHRRGEGLGSYLRCLIRSYRPSINFFSSQPPS